ncbi:VLF-1b [Macrobrachium rosenbergii nudivirus]|nr:VLF-1b [Macrobrachium rosenbergii nudivirus]
MSSLNCEKSHYSRFFRNVNTDELTDANIKNFLDGLKLKNNKQPSNNYKISILRTLKLTNKNITKNPKQLGYVNKRKSNMKNLFDIKSAVLAIIAKTFNLSDFSITKITSRGLLDTYIAILITVSCVGSINDILSLTEKDFDELINKQVVIKKKHVRINAKIFATAIPLVNRLINHRNSLDNHVDTNKLVSCKVDTINKNIRNLIIERCIINKCTLFTDDESQNIGLNKFKFKDIDVVVKYLMDMKILS